MNNRFVVVLVAAGVLLLGVAVAGFAIYNWLLGPTLAASGPVTPIPVAMPTRTGAAAGTPADSSALVFNIDPAASEARFTLTEELRGQPKTVVGTTDQVVGQFAVDPSDLSTAQVGVIQINARTLTTDSGQRNNMIRNRILNTNNYEFITFAPTAITGLTGSGQPGSSYTFQVAGDLSIRAITQPVTFQLTVTAASESQLAGLATATVNRSDFDLVIPSVPQVANVSEQVTLELEFVANAAP